jgi:hypothetical protein
MVRLITQFTYKNILNINNLAFIRRQLDMLQQRN